MINNIENLAITIIDEEKNNQDKGDEIWKDSPYKLINLLKSNNVGNVGEKLLNKICLQCNINCNIDGSKTKQNGGGNMGDGIIKNKTVKIKTARLCKSGIFQHELGEHPWKSNYIIFIDFTPLNIYLTIIPNFTQEYYQTTKRKALPHFNKSITRRKEGSQDNSGNYKLSINEKDLDICKNTIKINQDTEIDNIKEFINTIIQ